MQSTRRYKQSNVNHAGTRYCPQSWTLSPNQPTKHDGGLKHILSHWAETSTDHSVGKNDLLDNVLSSDGPPLRRQSSSHQHKQQKPELNKLDNKQ